VWSTGLLAAASPAFRSRRWYRWLARSLAASGPAFIKWGQWSATRPDLFPEALCDALSELHSNAPAHPWEHTERSLAAALGLASPASLGLVFDAVERAPVASGSIAQVHRASLGGRLVAIKVRHPRVAALMDLDFGLMRLLAGALDRCVPAVRWLRARETVAQFGEGLRGQADLRDEARHLEALGHNFRGWPHVRFPRPVLAAPAVIVETFEPGRVVTTFLEMYDRLAGAINDEEEGGGPTEGPAEEGGGAPAIRPRLPGAGAEETGEEEEDGGGDDDDGGVDRVRGYQLIPNSIAKFLVTTGLAVYLKMLLVDNLMHADLYERGWSWSPPLGSPSFCNPASPFSPVHFGFALTPLTSSSFVANLWNRPGTRGTSW
jgi:hypothetical protein